MRLLAFIFLFVISFLSCKKEEVVEVIPASRALRLNIFQVVNDSTILLNWTKPHKNHFQKYKLVREANYLKNGEYKTFYEPVDSSNNINDTSFTETKMPLARHIFYQLQLSKDTTAPQGGFTQVVEVHYERPNSVIEEAITDALIDTQRQSLYVTTDKEITILDYNGRYKATRTFPVQFGYCSLGDFNGAKELYVPRWDGWLEIYDAATLQLKDRIYIAEASSLNSVVAHNNKLYVHCNDKVSFSSDANNLKVYDRSTKTVVQQTGYTDNARIIMLAGTSVELIEIGFTNLSYYQFTSTGTLVSKKHVSGVGSINPNVAKSFPGGTRFIVSGQGSIFDKSLTFERHLKQYGNYSDFAFSSDGSVMYVQNGSGRIDAVSYPANVALSSYPTRFTPVKFFRDGNILVCLSRASASNWSGIVVEKINL